MREDASATASIPTIAYSSGILDVPTKAPRSRTALPPCSSRQTSSTVVSVPSGADIGPTMRRGGHPSTHVMILVDDEEMSLARPIAPPQPHLDGTGEDQNECASSSSNGGGEGMGDHDRVQGRGDGRAGTEEPQREPADVRSVLVVDNYEWPAATIS